MKKITIYLTEEKIYQKVFNEYYYIKTKGMIPYELMDNILDDLHRMFVRDKALNKKILRELAAESNVKLSFNTWKGKK